MTLTEALRKLHEQGRIRSPWLPGMFGYVGFDLGRVFAGNADGAFFSTTEGRKVYPADRMHTAEWSLPDPATVGCLLALLREAGGRPYVGLDFFDHTDRRWRVFDPHDDAWLDWPSLRRETEGEAIAAALIALAGAS